MKTKLFIVALQLILSFSLCSQNNLAKIDTIEIDYLNPQKSKILKTIRESSYVVVKVKNIDLSNISVIIEDTGFVYENNVSEILKNVFPLLTLNPDSAMQIVTNPLNVSSNGENLVQIKKDVIRIMKLFIDYVHSLEESNNCNLDFFDIQYNAEKKTKRLIINLIEILKDGYGDFGYPYVDYKDFIRIKLKKMKDIYVENEKIDINLLKEDLSYLTEFSHHYANQGVGMDTPAVAENYNKLVGDFYIISNSVINYFNYYTNENNFTYTSEPINVGDNDKYLFDIKFQSRDTLFHCPAREDIRIQPRVKGRFVIDYSLGFSSLFGNSKFLDENLTFQLSENPNGDEFITFSRHASKGRILYSPVVFLHAYPRSGNILQPALSIGFGFDGKDAENRRNNNYFLGGSLIIQSGLDDMTQRIILSTGISARSVSIFDYKYSLGQAYSKSDFISEGNINIPIKSENRLGFFFAASINL